jgi:hypothetical protein
MITFFTLKTMQSSFADLQTQLGQAAPAVHVPVASSLGGVVATMDNLTLEDQGAALPGTRVAYLRAPSPKLYFPVVALSAQDVCLAIISQGLLFCLSTSCMTVSHQEVRLFIFLKGPAFLIQKASFLCKADFLTAVPPRAGVSIK